MENTKNTGLTGIDVINFYKEQLKSYKFQLNSKCLNDIFNCIEVFGYTTFAADIIVTPVIEMFAQGMPELNIILRVEDVLNDIEEWLNNNPQELTKYKTI